MVIFEANYENSSKKCKFYALFLDIITKWQANNANISIKLEASVDKILAVFRNFVSKMKLTAKIWE